jgi:nucleotide-binding universal stress UspA family protein
VDAKAVASMLDDVAIECSPNNDVASNPAKDLALMLADALPLVWGGSVLAARAARRVVEALRLATGRPALAADAGHLLPVLNQPPRDLFADPFDKPEELRPGLVILDDGVEDAGVAEHRRKLEEKAERHDVRVHVVTQANGTDIARYAALTQHGRYAAAYLGIGLGRYGTQTDEELVEPKNPSEDPAW